LQMAGLTGKRIVHYYPRAASGDGGVTNAMWAWAEAQAEFGLNVAVLHMEEPTRRPIPDSISSIGMPHIVGPSKRTLRPKRLEDHLTSDDVLILHSGWLLHNLVAGRAAMKASVPYVVVPHGALFPKIRFRRRHLKGLWEPWERALFRRAAAVHVFFDQEVNEARSFSPSTPVIIGPTGAQPSQRTWTGGGGYIAWLGRFDIEHKGLDLLMETARRFDPEDGPRFILHGKPSRNSSDEVKELAESMGVGDLVAVNGPITGPEKDDFLNRA